MIKTSIVILLIFSGLLSSGQTWDANEWGKDIKTAVMVEDTFNYSGFRIIDRRIEDRKSWSIDTVAEEIWYKLRIELLAENSGSNLVIKSHSNEFDVSNRYDGFEIKARLGLKTATLYVGEVIGFDTVWLDTLVFKIVPLEPLTSLIWKDSVCKEQVTYNQEIFGGLGYGRCNYLVPCKITGFKIKLEGSVNQEFEVVGSRVPKEVINEFHKLRIGDVVTFYDIAGITSKYKTEVNFRSSGLVLKTCNL